MRALRRRLAPPGGLRLDVGTTRDPSGEYVGVSRPWGMVSLRAEARVFGAAHASVRRVGGRGDRQSGARLQRPTERRVLSDSSGPYCWEQELDGEPGRFTLRRNAFPRAGIVYEVRAGPSIGSRSVLCSVAVGARAGVSVLGEFVSPTRADARIETAVTGLWAGKFDPDRATTQVALRAGPRSAPLPPPRG